MQTAAAYIRVSTDDQLEYSPDSQLDLLREYAKAHGLLLPDKNVFREAEGISGRKADRRPEFQRMIAMAKKSPDHLTLSWSGSSRASHETARTVSFINPC